MADLEKLRIQAIEARKRKRLETPTDGSLAPDSQRPRQSSAAANARKDAASAGHPADAIMNSADFEEGEISEESEDESEAIAAMIIAPRLQTTRRTASPISHLPTPPAEEDGAQFRHRTPGEPLQHLIGREVVDVPYTPTSPTHSSSADGSHFRTKSPPVTLPPAAEMTETISTSDRQPDPPAVRTAEETYQAVQAMVVELHRWGVTSDYMMNQGVEKDLVIRIHLEQNLPLPLHHKQNYLQRQAEREGFATAPLPSKTESISENASDTQHAKKTHKQGQPSIRMGSVLPVPLPRQVTRHRSTSSESSVSSTSLPAHLPARPDWSHPAALPRQPDLSEIEAKAREQLLARKAALAAARSKAAQAETNPKAAIAPGVATAEAASDKPLFTVAKDEDDAMEISSEDDDGAATVASAALSRASSMDGPDNTNIAGTREKVLDLSEEVSDNAVRQPFSGALEAGPLSPALSAPETLTFRKSLHPSAPKSRPVASDFLNESVSNSTRPRWSAQVSSAANSQGMVIDLSDNEDDNSDDEELRQSVEEARQQQELSRVSSYRKSHFRLQLPRSARVSSEEPRPALPMPSPHFQEVQLHEASPQEGQNLENVKSPADDSASASSGDGARHQLEAKEAEIKRMMEMINRLEGKKKAKTGSGSQSGTPTSSAVASPALQHARLPVVDEKSEKAPTVQAPIATQINHELPTSQVEQLKDAKHQLERERDDLLAEHGNSMSIAQTSQLPQTSSQAEVMAREVSSSDESEAMLVIRRDTSSDVEGLPGLQRVSTEKPEAPASTSDGSSKVRLSKVEGTEHDTVTTINGTSKCLTVAVFCGRGPALTWCICEEPPGQQASLEMSDPPSTEAGLGRTGLQQDGPPLKALTVTKAAIITASRWIPYQSPFDLFPLSRTHASSASELPASESELESSEDWQDRMQITDATAFIPRSMDAVLAHHVRAWLCKERKLDVKEQKYCQYEMLGACNDDTCGRLHESSFVPSAEDAINFVKAVYGEPAGSKLSSARKEVYQQGLRLIIGRHFPAPSKKAIKEASSQRKWSSEIREMLRAAKAYYDSESAHLVTGPSH